MMESFLIAAFVVIGVFLGVREEWLHPGHPRFVLACVLAVALLLSAAGLVIIW